MKTINNVVGRSDQHLSSAIDSLSDIHVRLTMENNDDEDLLTSRNENKKIRKFLRRKSNVNDELERQTSSINRRFDLFQTARYGNLEHLKTLCQENQSNRKVFFNRLDPETKLTALHYAARFNHYEICRYLIEHCEADVNKAGDEGMKPLHYVARFRVEKDTQADAYETVVRYLIHHGAYINSRDDSDSTPLHHACERNNVLCAKILISEHADIEAADRQDMRPLHGASFYGCVDTARLLIEHDADVLAADKTKSIPFAHACRHSHYNILEMFFNSFEQHPKINDIITATDSESNTLLHLAVASANLQIVELLLSKNADPSAKRENQQTPIHLCAKNDSVEILERLINAQGDISDIDNGNETILHKAAAYNKEHVLRYALSKQNSKEFVQTKNSAGLTALLLAATYGHASCIALLLENGADMFDDRDKCERSSIYLACMGNRLQALEVLLQHARDSAGLEKEKSAINEIDRYSRTGLHAAAGSGHVEIVRELLRRQASLTMKDDDEHTALMLCCKKNRLDVLKVFIEFINGQYQTTREKFSIYEQRDDGSNTALHIAASEGHPAIIVLLIEQGCDLEARNMISWLPIHCAAERGRYNCVRILLEHHSSVDPVDKNQQTPLHLAARNGHAEVVKLLLKHRAVIDKYTSNGDNCLDLAINSNQYSVAEALVNSDKWASVLRNAKYDAKTKRWDTPMRKLIRKMPDIALIILNKCCTIISTGKNDPSSSTDENNQSKRKKKQPKSVHEDVIELEEQLNNNYTDTGGLTKDETQLEKLKLVYVYEFLDDQFALQTWRDKPEIKVYEPDGRLYPGFNDKTLDRKVLQLNHPFTIMVDEKNENLLDHPLVHSLLEYKWRLFASYFYYFNFLFYLLFVASLTAYVFLAFAPYHFGITQTQMEELNCQELCLFIKTNRTEEINKYQYRIHGINIFKWFVIVLAAIQLVKEIHQIISQPLDYITLENAVELPAFILSIIFTVDLNRCAREIGYRCVFQWQLGALSILLTWFALVLFMKKFPRFGIFVVMFTDILRTFSRFFLVFFLFIIGFALAFHMLLQNHNPFQHFGNSLLKTCVMMIGEFEYEGIFHGENGNYFGVTYFLFVIFVIIMSIIIMNLLVGLAVDDIASVMRIATVKRLEMRVLLTLDVERQLPRKIFYEFIRRYRTITYQSSSWRKFLNRTFHINIPTEFHQNFTRLENYGLVPTAGSQDQKNTTSVPATNLPKVDESSKSAMATTGTGGRGVSTDWISNVHAQINTKYNEFNRHMAELKTQQEKINNIIQQLQATPVTSRQTSHLTFAPTTS